MCGICGFNWDDRQLVRRMASKLRHRGPDASGFLLDNGVSLGFRRLAIIDLSKQGNQPIFNEDRSLAIVFNGEIYNFPELRKELESKGHRFSSKTDTETILHCYEEYGTSCLEKLNGMFAFCIYDTRNKRLFLARDRLGIKPLYYYFDGRRFIFASEIKSILVHDVKPEVNRAALNPYLKFKFVPGPDTMFKGIKKIQPGHYILFSLNPREKKRLVIKQYWDLDFSESRKSESGCVEEISKLLEHAVKRRLISDVPLGVFLSGGLDSSLITAIMSKFQHEVKTFSVGFSDRHHNELPFAREVSDMFSTKHHELWVESFDIETLLPRIAYALDEPVADWAAIPTYQIASLARKKVKVALAGDGGDEVFVGYRQSILHHYGRPLRFMPRTITSLLPLSSRLRRAAEILRMNDPVARAASWITVFTPDQRAQLLDNSSVEPLPLYEQYRARMSQWSLLNQNLYLEAKTWLPDDLLMKIDKTTMMTSLEARVPFLDHRLVEFVSQIPSSMKMRGFTTKYLLKKVALKYLPKSIVFRKKHGFTLPLDKWFRTELKGFAEEKILSSAMQRYFQKSYLKKILRMHNSRAADLGFHISTLISFSLWHEEFIGT